MYMRLMGPGLLVLVFWGKGQGQVGVLESGLPGDGSHSHLKLKKSLFWCCASTVVDISRDHVYRGQGLRLRLVLGLPFVLEL